MNEYGEKLIPSLFVGLRVCWESQPPRIWYVSKQADHDRSLRDINRERERARARLVDGRYLLLL